MGTPGVHVALNLNSSRNSFVYCSAADTCSPFSNPFPRSYASHAVDVVDSKKPKRAESHGVSAISTADTGSGDERRYLGVIVQPLPAENTGQPETSEYLLLSIFPRHAIVEVGIHAMTSETIRFSVNVILKEYETLRNEILNRTRARLQLLVLVGAVMPLVVGFEATAQTIAAGVTAMIIGITVWFWLGFNIKRCAERLREIEAEVNALVGQDLLKWETEMPKERWYHNQIR